ncbi:hypothetical protein V8C86DRAFT_208634 [Haematococcus lacustris]
MTIAVSRMTIATFRVLCSFSLSSKVSSMRCLSNVEGFVVSGSQYLFLLREVRPCEPYVPMHMRFSVRPSRSNRWPTSLPLSSHLPGCGVGLALVDGRSGIKVSSTIYSHSHMRTLLLTATWCLQ